MSDFQLFKGWPHQNITKGEAEGVRTVFHELRLQDLNVDSDRCWYLAGQIVARMKRDNVIIFGDDEILYTNKRVYKIREKDTADGKCWSVVFTDGSVEIEDCEWTNEAFANNAKIVYENNWKWFGADPLDIIAEYYRFNRGTLTYLKS